MRDYIRLAGTLLLVCIVAAALLGFTNIVTYDKIVEQTIKANDEARKAVLANATSFDMIDFSNPELSTVLEVYEAKNNDNIVGYAVKVAPKGYAGTVYVMVGIDVNGIIQGVKVGDNNETPGLGKNAEAPSFQNQYNGKTWDTSVNVIKNGTPKDSEIVAVAGATITSKAVTKGVNEALVAIKELTGK